MDFSFLRGMVTKDHLAHWEVQSFGGGGKGLIITKENNYSKKVGTEVRVGTLKMRQVLNWSI